MSKDKKKDYNFKKKFMHPTRRKLVDMVHTGKYDKDTVISQSTGTKKSTSREIGDEWEDDKGNVWVQRDGYKIKKSKNTETLRTVRHSIEKSRKCQSDSCKKKGRYGYTDKQLIKDVGFCSDCLVEREHPIRVNGDYEDYTRYRMFCNLYIDGMNFIEKLKNAYDQAKQEYEYVDGDGKIQTWTLERPVEELKKEIQEDIDKTNKQIDEIEVKISELYDRLKDKDYELVEMTRNVVKQIENCDD